MNAKQCILLISLTFSSVLSSEQEKPRSKSTEPQSCFFTEVFGNAPDFNLLTPEQKLTLLNIYTKKTTETNKTQKTLGKRWQISRSNSTPPTN